MVACHGLIMTKGVHFSNKLMKLDVNKANLLVCVYFLISFPVYCFLSTDYHLAFSEEEVVRQKIHLNLEQAVDLAFRHNRDLLGSRDSVTRSQYSLESAETEFEFQPVPNSTGSVEWNSAGNNRDFEHTYGMDVSKKLKIGTELDFKSTIDPSDKTKTSTQGFTITQPLLQGFGRSIVTNSLINAERSVISTERNYELAREGLAVNIIKQYYEIIKQRKILEINDAALEREKLVLESAKARLTVGLSSRLDVSRAEIQTQQAEENLINARQSIGDAEDVFKVDLNLPVDAELELVPELDYPPFKIVESVAIATALEYRLDLIEESDRIWDSKRNLKVVKNKIWPKLDLFLEYKRFGEGDTFGSSFDFKDSGFTIGFRPSDLGLNRKSKRAAYESSKISLVSQKRSYNLLVDTIKRNVRDGIRALENKYKNIPIQKKAFDEAKSGLDVANERYIRNLADNFDIVDAEENLLRAEVGHITAVTDYIVEHVRFRKTIGTLTEKPEILLRRHTL
jgi:OMF family outer membrane factor